MNFYRIYGYVEVQVEAENKEEALAIFEEECVDEVLSVIDIEEVK